MSDQTKTTKTGERYKNLTNAQISKIVSDFGFGVNPKTPDGNRRFIECMRLYRVLMHSGLVEAKRFCEKTLGVTQ